MDRQSNDSLRLLLIEDNPDDAHLIKRMVAKEASGSVGITWTNRLSDGIASLAEENLDVLLLDLSLPDSDGLQAISQLRERASEIPIVVLTGYNDEMLARRAIQEGAQDYLIKGQMDSRSLLHALRYAVGRKRAETERTRLLASEQRARTEAERVRKQTVAILERISDAFIALDPEWRFAYLNQRAGQLLHRPTDELVGKGLWDAFPRLIGSAIERELRRAVDEQARLDLELEYPPLNAWFELHAYPSPEGTSIYFRDITERKRAEQTLRESDERIRLMVDGVKDYAIFMLDPTGRVVSWNEGAKRIKGYHADEIIGQHFSRFYPQEEIQHGKPDTLLKAAATNGRSEDEGWRVRKDGSRFWASVVITALRDEHGSLRGFAKVTRDITERKRTEERLAQQAETLREVNKQLVLTSVRLQEVEEERECLLDELANERTWLRTVIDRSPVGIFLIEGAQGEQVTVNRQTEELFGTSITPNAGIDQYQKLLFAADGSPLGHAELSPVRALAGEVITALERRIRREDGQTVPVLVSAGPIKDEQGNILGAVVIFDDITAIKELERHREEWISIVSHDLRQPVTVIGGFADLLAMDLPASSEQQREIEHIRTSVRHLSKLIADLGDASQVETNRFTLNRKWVDFPALVHAIVQRNAEIVGEGRVKVTVDGEVPRLWIDPARIEQVLTNFLTNAARYGDPTMPILVRLSRCGEEVEVSVTNQGPGIARDDIPYVFSRFYRTRAAKERRRGGLGLGLYIAKGIVEAHGGRIWVESIPNQTTTFHFTASGQGKLTRAETGDGGASRA